MMKKNRKFTKIPMLSILMMSLVLVGMTSCENEFNDPQNIFDQNAEAPVITSVNEVRENTPVTEGVLENLYYIKGKNLGSVTSIKYNGYESGFNPVYVTETLIISSIPEEAPYLNGINKLRVETLYGVTEYDFSLLYIEEFEEETVDGENIVTLYGGDFTNVDSVIFSSGNEEDGNLVENEAEIKSVSKTEVAVAVPAGTVQAFINLITKSGAIVTSASYGFNYPIFTDALNGWQLGGWDGDQAISSEVSLGAASIRRESLNWGGLTLTPEEGAEELVIADYSTVTFQIFPANPRTTSVNIALNDFAVSVNLTLVPGEWNKFVLPLTDFYPAGTAPETITRMDFQEASGGDAPFLFYVDQFGFIQ